MIAVGTIHLDIKGPKRLRNLLERYKPIKISIEYPKRQSINEAEQRLLNLQRIRETQAKNSDLPDNLKQIAIELAKAIGYEIIIPIQYHKEKCIEIYFVDHIDRPVICEEKDFAEKFRIGLGDIVEKLKKVPHKELRKYYVQMIDKCYHNPNLFNKLMEDLPEEEVKFPEKLTEEEFQEQREQFMADELFRIQPDLHIGGLEHIFREGDFLLVPSLYQRLGNAITKRMKLCEFKEKSVKL